MLRQHCQRGSCRLRGANPASGPVRAGTVLLTSKEGAEYVALLTFTGSGEVRPDRWIDPEASFGTVMTAS